MNISHQELERLDNLELRQYAGDLDAIIGDDKKLYDQLMQSPVELMMTAPKGICENELFDICLSAQGRYSTFGELRRHIMQKLFTISKNPGFNLLSVLFDGIYAGEPEDLLNYRNNRPQGIFYPIQGLGEKLADVKFN